MQPSQNETIDENGLPTIHFQVLCFSGRLTFPFSSFLKLSHLWIFYQRKKKTSRYEVDFRRGCFKEMERSTFHLNHWLKWGPHKTDYFELKGRPYIIVSGHFFLGRPNYCSPFITVFFWTHFPQSNLKGRWAFGETSTPESRVQT